MSAKAAFLAVIFSAPMWGAYYIIDADFTLRLMILGILIWGAIFGQIIVRMAPRK